jgi:hypothetical protein
MLLLDDTIRRKNRRLRHETILDWDLHGKITRTVIERQLPVQPVGFHRFLVPALTVSQAWE